MARVVTEQEKKLVDELYRKHGGVWAKIFAEFKSDPRFQNRQPTVESLQKIHKRYTRGILDVRSKASLTDLLQAAVASHVRRVKHLEARERRYKLELAKIKSEKERLEEHNRNLRAEATELKAKYDPKIIGLRVVSGRDVMAVHSDVRR